MGVWFQNGAVRSQRLDFRNWTWTHTQCDSRHLNLLLINLRQFGFQGVLEILAQHSTVIAITGGGGALRSGITKPLCRLKCTVVVS